MILTRKRLLMDIFLTRRLSKSLTFASLRALISSPELHLHVNSSTKKFYCIDPQHGRLVTWLQTKRRPKNKMYLRKWKHELMNELMNERLECNDNFYGSLTLITNDQQEMQCNLSF